ncbi:MAG TPA: hypothetical protein VGE63_01280 [Candidatus Paceibacterota bacterium]
MKNLIFLIAFFVSTTTFAQYYSETAPDFITVKGSARFGDGWGNSSSFGKKSFAAGLNNTVTGENSIACGVGLNIRTPNQVVLGTYNIAYGSSTSGTTGTDPLVIIGNGVASWAPSNAMVILRNGNIGIGPHTWPPTAQLHIAYDEYKNPDEAAFRADGSTYSTTIHDDMYEDVNINGGNDYSFVNLARPAGQRVGIGANPDNGPEKLYVKGHMKVTGYVGSTEGFYIYNTEPTTGSLVPNQKSFLQRLNEMAVVSYKKDSVVVKQYLSINPAETSIVSSVGKTEKAKDYIQVVNTLVGAVKELAEGNKLLKAEIEKLKKK